MRVEEGPLGKGLERTALETGGRFEDMGRGGRGAQRLGWWVTKVIIVVVVQIREDGLRLN